MTLATIGDNGGPPLDPTEFDQDFISARMIARGAEYLQFFFRAYPEAAHILVKRKGSVSMAYRHLLAHGLRNVVPAETMARILGLNRKTMGENQQRVEVWGEHESEEGYRIGQVVEELAEIIYRHAKLDPEEADRLLRHFAKLDPQLRRAEKRARLAALEADRAAAALEAKAKAKREAKRQHDADALAKSLKGVSNKDALVAQHRGPAATAHALSGYAKHVLEALAKAAAKQRVLRLPASMLHAQGLSDCVRLGLAKASVPYLSEPKDPMYAATPFGLRVYMEAVAADLLEKPKRKQA